LAAVKAFALMIVRKDQRVFHAANFLRATEGDSFERSLAAFRSGSLGRQLLQNRSGFWEKLSDRSTLQACPPDSLGRWYVEHMKSCGLDELYYLGVVRELTEQLENDPERAWMRNRIDFSHDLRHVVTGYGNDDLGEACLQSFRFGQTRHFGVLFLSLFVLLRVALLRRGPALRPWREAYRRGLNAKLLDLVLWENTFDQPLSLVRAVMRLDPAKHYPTSVAPGAYIDRSSSAQLDTCSKALSLDAI
jgi:ubiquinone biosynthesis protein COQ4